MCVCLNGEPTPDDCDKIGLIFISIENLLFALIEIGIWTEFNDWTTCSVTCGEGYRIRKRECLSANNQTEKISSEHCLGKEAEIELCEVTTCPSK
jgi:hypothetical protein